MTSNVHLKLHISVRLDNKKKLGLIQDLFSYNTIKRKRVFEYYFFTNATLTSPVMSTEGIDNIQQ